MDYTSIRELVAEEIEAVSGGQASGGGLVTNLVGDAGKTASVGVISVGDVLHSSGSSLARLSVLLGGL